MYEKNLKTMATAKNEKRETSGRNERMKLYVLASR